MAQPLRAIPASGLLPRTSGTSLGSSACGTRGLAPTITGLGTGITSQGISGRPLVSRVESPAGTGSEYRASSVASNGSSLSYTGLPPRAGQSTAATASSHNGTMQPGLATTGPSALSAGASPAADRVLSNSAGTRPVAHPSAAPAGLPTVGLGRATETTSARPLSAQSNKSSSSVQQAKPDLRRWTDEDLKRQIQLLEQGLKSAVTGSPPAVTGSAPAVASSTAGVATSAGVAAVHGPVASGPVGISTPSAMSPGLKQGSPMVKTPSYTGAPVANLSTSATSAGVSTTGTRSSSEAPPESTDGEMRKRILESQSAEAPAHLEAQLSLKERQVVELRAQIARCEKQLYGGTAVASERSENEHTDPERTGPPGTPGTVTPAGLVAGAPLPTSVSALPGAPPLPTSLASLSVERMVSSYRASDAGGSTAGANTPVPSTPGGRDGTSTLSQLEGELAWVVKQMEAHRHQIQHHQRQLSALEKRHAEIVGTISAQGIGGGRSPASTVISAVADRLEQAVEDSTGLDSVAVRLAKSRELIEASPTDPLSVTREGCSGLDGALSSPVPSSLAVSATKAAEQAARGFGARGSSRPTSASSAASHGSREVGSAVGSTVSRGSRSSNPFAAKAALDGIGSRSRGASNSRAQSEESWSAAPATSHVADADTWRAGEPWKGDALSNWPAGQGSEDVDGASLRSFGKSYEAERIVYLLTQFGMRRPLRIPFVPLDAAAEGEGRPYLHGSLEVRLCLSEDGNRLMVRVGSGPAGVGGRLFEIEEFVNRAEAIEARKWQRPSSIAEETEIQSPIMPSSPLPPAGNGTSLLPPAGNGSINTPAPATLETSAMPTLNTLLGKGKVDPNASSLPWKKLFKSHWS